jgi:hypothetical protein
MFLYRVLDINVKHVASNTSIRFLGVFEEVSGNLRRQDAESIDVNAKLIRLDPYEMDEHNISYYKNTSPEEFQNYSWHSMYGAIQLGKVSFVSGLFTSKEAAYKAVK